MTEKLQVLHEDNHIIVVLKPQNVPSQPDSSQDKDMTEIVKEYLKSTHEKPGNVYLGLVHRLDRPTGGVMVFAKTSKAAERLSESIREGEMQKKYYAVVEGEVKKPKAHLTNYLRKNSRTNIVEVVPQAVEDAKRAELDYEVVDTVSAKGGFSLVSVNLITGRSHQIRVQLKHIGHPIVGDYKYGAKQKVTKNLALWAYELKFEHPITKDLYTFKVMPPVEEVPWKIFNITA